MNKDLAYALKEIYTLQLKIYKLLLKYVSEAEKEEKDIEKNSSEKAR